MNWFKPIPTTLEESVSRLYVHLEEEDKNYLKEYESSAFHYNLGQEIRNQWKLWQRNTILYNYFWNKYKIWHADDMSSIILDQLEANLKGESFDIDKEVRNYHIYWEAVMGIIPGKRLNE